jgi:histidyl-tRNA synthetase
MSESIQAAKASAPPLKAVKGMNDILPPDSARWEWFEDVVRRLMARYAYRGVRGSHVEQTPRRCSCAAWAR